MTHVPIAHLALLFVVLAAPVARADIAFVSGRPSPGTICVNDAVRVDWTVQEWSGVTELVWIEVRDLSTTGNSDRSTENRTVARFDVFQYGHHNHGGRSSSLAAIAAVPKPLQRRHSVIQCLPHDASLRTPDVTTVEWSKSDEESLLVINFSEPTNRPSLDGPVSLNDAIVFNHGEVEMSAGSGSWTPDGLALNITHVDAASWEAITASISSATLHVIPRLKLFAGATSSNQHHNTDNTGPGAPLQGNLTMRMSFPGRISVRLFVGDVLEATSPEAIEVTLCADDVYVKGAKSTASVGKEGIGARKVPRPFFAMDGVVAMPGDEWIKIPHSAFPIQGAPLVDTNIDMDIFTHGRKASWSVAFWMYLVDDATGSFRGLFYKGDGSLSMGRTPSAWLCPYSNRITLRVTSGTNPDIGSESRATVNAGEWNHLVFSFDNTTEDGFSGTIFVNGAVDVCVTFEDIQVVPNDGPLFVGRDPSNPGPRSFISLLQLYEGRLSPTQVDHIFEASRGLFHGTSSRAMASRYPAMHAVVSFISTTWGKLSSFRTSCTSTWHNRRAPSSDENILENPDLHELRNAAYHTATRATMLCRTVAERLEMYRVAAEAGHVESRTRYTSLLLLGREGLHGHAESLCGREHENETRKTAETKWNAGGFRVAVKQLDTAVRDGSHEAALALALLILSGLGGGSAHNHSSAACEGCRAYRSAPTLQLIGVGVGAAVYDQSVGNAHSANTGAGGFKPFRTWDVSATSRAIGLLHFAALGGHPEAQLALGLRYLEGNGVQLDMETAAWYLGCAAKAAHKEYHTLGKQPALEQQRLTEANEETFAKGQEGEDDGAIQFQIHQAENGNIASQVALGDLYYWGARGMPRDQVQALRYFETAARAGDNTARCAAAGMYLKGEGTTGNHTRAVELYELAAEENHVRAFNGLGYEYFNGNALPRNLTKAYEHFQRAADMKQDSDSLYNAGHCLATGAGTTADLERAAELFRIGAGWGHVDCAYELGIMSIQGRGVKRSPADAVKYLQIVGQVGPWGRRLRTAFECYIQGDTLCAFALYVQAAELGYEVAASNAAFLLDRAKVDMHGLHSGGDDELRREGSGGGESALPAWSDTMATRLHIMAATKGYLPSFLAIGDAFFYGKGGLQRDTKAAWWWYSRASTSGLARGAYNLGYMYEHGLGVPRDYEAAWAHYDRARKIMPVEGDVDQRMNGVPIEVLVFLAKTRLKMNRASGGRLSALWVHAHEYDSADWLPHWMLLTAIANTLRAFVQWTFPRRISPNMLGHLAGTSREKGPRLPTVFCSMVTIDNVLLVILSFSLLAVLSVRAKRSKPRSRS